jgi:hypothetical protein
MLKLEAVTFTNLLGITYQKSAVLILTAVRTSRLTHPFTFYFFPPSESLLLMKKAQQLLSLADV